MPTVMFNISDIQKSTHKNIMKEIKLYIYEANDNIPVTIIIFCISPLYILLKTGSKQELLNYFWILQNCAALNGILEAIGQNPDGGQDIPTRIFCDFHYLFQANAENPKGYLFCRCPSQVIIHNCSFITFDVT
jgi:hypothetical protein